MVELVTDSDSVEARDVFLRQVAMVAERVDIVSPWTTIELPLRYGAEGVTATYHFRMMRSGADAQVAELPKTSF